MAMTRMRFLELTWVRAASGPPLLAYTRRLARRRRYFGFASLKTRL
jgi:hypothetical protein